MYSIAVTNHHIVCGTYENLIHVRSINVYALQGLTYESNGHGQPGKVRTFLTLRFLILPI